MEENKMETEILVFQKVSFKIVRMSAKAIVKLSPFSFIKCKQ